MTDREKLVELISQIQYMGGLESRLAEHLLANGVRLESKQATSDENKRWIPVMQRLPDTQMEVLTYSECNGVRSACLLAADDETQMWYLCRTDKLSIAVTHWMPLPEPPEKE